MKSITQRLVLSYFIVIFITVSVLEVFLISALDKYYNNNMKELVENQIKASADFYNNYFSSSSLEKNIEDNTDIFWKNTNAEVQIINKDKKMLLDSVGNFTEEKVAAEDVEKALEGKLSSTTAKDKATGERIMYMSYPLMSSGKIEGVLRFVTSLSEVDEITKRITYIFASLGLVVIVISSLISIKISNSIVKPIKEVTNMAKRIAEGNFNERLSIHRKDEIGTLSMAFNSMTEEILKNDKLKNEFIASVSHELRTPLTSIKGWASTLKTGQLDNKSEIIDGLNIIEKESDRLTLMVEELLDFSRFISGKVSLKKDHIDIRNNLLYLEKQFMPRAKRQNINFAVKLQENMHLIFADENRVNQVIINILDNAFKFTPADGNVEMTCAEEEDSIVIKVSDTGMGIPKDELPHVMEKFFKGKSSMSKNGLGLSISKEIMELHSGTISIESTFGEGTIVTIKFPINKEEGAKA